MNENEARILEEIRRNIRGWAPPQQVASYQRRKFEAPPTPCKGITKAGQPCGTPADEDVSVVVATSADEAVKLVARRTIAAMGDAEGWYCVARIATDSVERIHARSNT